VAVDPPTAGAAGAARDPFRDLRDRHQGGGESLTWSLEGYLDALERRLADGLDKRAPGRTDEARR
jgi:hypothetical protein